MRRCNRCILPDTVPGITFDEKGICNFCHSHSEESCLGEEALEKLISLIRSKDNKYDCIVPLSGGRDSTFVLYIARAVYNLKVLAVSIAKYGTRL